MSDDEDIPTWTNQRKHHSRQHVSLETQAIIDAYDYPPPHELELKIRWLNNYSYTARLFLN